MSQELTLGISLNTSLLELSDLPALLQEFQDLQPELDDVIQPFLVSQEQTAFQTHGASIGEVWAPASDAWVNYKKTHGFSTDTLHYTEALSQSIGTASEQTGNSITVGTDVPYAPYLQNKMPNRVFMKLTDDDIEALILRLQEFIASRCGVPAAAVLITAE